MQTQDIFSVKIDFAQSHLFFPQIIHWALLILLVVIIATQAIPYWRAVRAGDKQLPFTEGGFDRIRFFGTLILTVAYFLLMPAVGEYFPNTGLGFLLMSMPYMFLLSLLYVHKRDGHHLIRLTVNAIAAPLIAWYLLAHLFAITLP